MADPGAISEFIANLRLTDHHCHGLAAKPPGRDGFELLAADSQWPPPAGHSIFDSPVGLAIRHFCAPLLDLAANASAESYWERRAGLGDDEVTRRLMGRRRRPITKSLTARPIRMRSTTTTAADTATVRGTGRTSRRRR